MISQRGKSYRSFFQKLIDELREKHNFTNARAGQPRNFYHFTSGVISGVYYDAFFAKDERVIASVLIDVKDGEENGKIFDYLEQDRTEIEAEFGSRLEWSKANDVRACSIRAGRPGSIKADAKSLADIHAWLIENLLKLKKVFGKRLHAYSKTAKDSSQGKLSALADEALAEFRRGETKPLDEL